MANKKQIIEVIKEYEKSSFDNYAILIDGDWGSGKTYFVKEELIQELNKTAIYVSLYGISKLEEVDKQIYNCIIKEFAEGNETGKKISDFFETKTGKTIKQVAKVVSDVVGVPKIDINSFISIYEDLNKYVLIFDDLERCKIEANEILGYINNFVEHKGCRCIIIANQKEMNKKNAYQNIEQKMMIALDNRIIYDRKSSEEELANIFLQDTGTSKGKPKQTEFKISEVNDRIYELFNEDKLYNQIKEKLIGKVLYYKPDLLEILEVLIKDKKFNDIREIVEQYKTNIIRIFTNKNHTNIRTLKIGLNNIKIIVNNIDTKRFQKDEYYEELLSKIVSYTFEATINDKEGTERTTEWETYTEFCEVYNTNEMSVNFKFIDVLVTKGIIEKENINKVIEDYLKVEKAKGTNNNDPINVLKYGWFHLEDKDIIRNLEELLKRLLENTYEMTQYSRILMLFIITKNMGFNKKYLEECLTIMKSNIEKNDCTNVNFSDFDVHFGDKQNAEEYKQNIDILSECLLNNKKLENKNTINSTINGEDDWAEQFMNYCDKNEFMNEKQFMKLIDIKNLINVIKKSKTKDIRDFGRELNTIYGFQNINEYFQDDKENLELLDAELKELDKSHFSISKKYAINFVEESIEAIIKKLN